MSDERIPQWMEEIKKRLSGRRYRHTLGVAFTSASLAMRYAYDPDIAFTAGLFHDIAKEFSKEKTLRLCEENAIPISQVEKRNTVLLHGKLGAFVAKTEFSVTNKEILDAIRCHTTGKPEMNLLEKILFTADYIEPLRDRRGSNLDTIRQLSFMDLDAAIVMITEETIQFLDGRGKEIDSMTTKTHDYYKHRAASSQNVQAHLCRQQ